MRGTQFLRQWKLLRLLEARKFGITVPELLAELKADLDRGGRRTVYRDLEFLQQAGFPVFSEKHDGKAFWFLAPEFKLPSVPFSPTELMSLYVGRGLLKPLEGTPLQAGIDSALHKIQKTLPESALGFLGTLGQTFATKGRSFKNYGKHAAKIQSLHDAIQKRRVLRVSYRKPDAAKADMHVYHPHALTYLDGSLYVIGWSATRGAMRTLVVDRIRSTQETPATFERRKGFDLDRHLRESFGIVHEGEMTEVKVAFDREVARWVEERTWHPSQKIERTPGGGIVLTLKVAGIRDVVPWVLSFGRNARALAPAELVKELAGHAKGMAGRYETK